MVQVGLHWLPIACFVMLPGTFLISYTIAVVLGHVEPGFPYISDTGTRPPESCIFAQLLNITSVVVGATVYVRYRHVKECNGERCGILRANKIAFALGLLAALGVSMVGNFQETNVLIVHLIGAMLAFGIGTVYCWITSIMSYKMCPEVSSRVTCHVRIAICVFTSIAFIIMFIFGSLSFKLYDGDDPRKWTPERAGWTEHLISTVAEWTMAIAMLLYFLTFVGEFRRIHLSEPQLSVIIADVISSHSTESSASYGTFHDREPLST